MNAFEKVIGYEKEKKVLMQVCDMILHPEKYERLGAHFPSGILLNGEPGIGKSLMAKCFMEAAGIPAFTVRKNHPDGEMVDHIRQVFEEAKEKAPSIVFLDDMDKFANEERSGSNAEEYVTIQSCIDEVAGKKVLVIATANEKNLLPKSLIRAGRMDKNISMSFPKGEDQRKIIAHYLEGKPVAEDFSIEDLASMMSCRSCAQLESLLNAAAAYAAYEGEESVSMKHFVHEYLTEFQEFEMKYEKAREKQHMEVAIHEAGHVAMTEILLEGSAGFAAIDSDGEGLSRGFMNISKDEGRRVHEILIGLAGKVAVEQKGGRTVASGCMSDLSRAAGYIRAGIEDNATAGVGFLCGRYNDASMVKEAAIDAAVNAELERQIVLARHILVENMEFVDKLAQALYEKKYLLASEIQAIRKECGVRTFEV